jgi:hypothetical protein
VAGHSIGSIEQDQVASVRNDHQLRARNFTMETLPIRQWNLLILIGPDNQRWFGSDLQVGGYSIEIIGNEQPNMLKKYFLAQFAIPWLDIVINDPTEVFSIDNGLRQSSS